VPFAGFDTAAVARALAQIADQPADFVDACYPTAANPLAWAIEQDRCKKLFPFAGDAHLSASAPATDNSKQGEGAVPPRQMRLSCAQNGLHARSALT